MKLTRMWPAATVPRRLPEDTLRHDEARRGDPRPRLRRPRLLAPPPSGPELSKISSRAFSLLKEDTNTIISIQAFKHGKYF